MKHSFLIYVCILSYVNCHAHIDINSIDKKLSSLSLREKIGQLFMVTATSDETTNLKFILTKPYRVDKKYITKLIHKYHIGGVIFLGTGTPKKQIARTNYFQQQAKTPLLIGQDFEWGLSMRLQNTISFPRALTLGATNNPDLIKEIGYEIGKQARSLGVHLVFAPVIDVNTNPDNPIIHMRSFGSNPDLVAHNALAYANGLRDAGIIACAKHFPGHGDTDVDSHYDLPYVRHTRTRLESVELKPFEKIIKANVPAIMTAHLCVPALDNTKNSPATVSKNIMTNLLRNQLGFTGLIITDALDMQGITKQFQSGEAELRALQAGADILLCSCNVPLAIERIAKAIESNEFSQTELNKRVRKILTIKQKMITQTRVTFNRHSLHTHSAYKLKQQAFRQAITLVRDTEKLLPIINENVSIPVVEIGASTTSTLTNNLKNETPIALNTRNDFNDTVCSQLANAPKIICALYTHYSAKIPKEIIALLEKLYAINPHTILVIFGSPYMIRYTQKFPTVIVAYEDDPDAQTAATDVLIGKLKPHGRLPV